MTANLNNLCQEIHMIKRDKTALPKPRFTRAELDAQADQTAAFKVKQQIRNLREYAHLTNQDPDFILDQLDKIRDGSYSTLSPFTTVTLEINGEGQQVSMHKESANLITVLVQAAGHNPTKPLLPSLVNVIYSMIKSVPRKKDASPDSVVPMAKLAYALYRKIPTTGPEEDDKEDAE
jgi:hypothetical protein